MRTFPTDSYYGHATVLAAYVGLESPPPMLAHLQHGWNPHVGFGNKYLGNGFPRGEERLSPLLPVRVWSDRNLQAAKSVGLRRVAAIGAPFVYLHEMVRNATSQSTPPPIESTIVYPIHSGGTTPATERRESEYVRSIAELEHGRNVTVCLYWRDHADPMIRRPYEEAGFEVISHGRRENPYFLTMQYEELRRHTRVVSNRVSTPVFYGGFLGASIEVYGPVFGSGDYQYSEWFDRLQRDEFSRLVEGGLHGEEAYQMAARELGDPHRRTPGELAELVGWVPSRRIPAVAAGVLMAVRRRLVGAS